MKFNNNGYTLVEILVVLAIASIITVASFAKLSYYDTNSKIAILQDRVATTSIAVENFIRHHCENGVFAQPTVFDLVNDGYLQTTSEADSPFNGTPFVLSVNWVYPYTYQIEADTGSFAKANSLLQSVNGNSAIGASIIFNKTYSRFVESDGTEGKVYRDMFEPAGGCL